MSDDARKAPSHGRMFVFAIAGFALLAILFRSPELIAEPRFWAEEASVYFAYAHVEGWWNALVFVPVAKGYLALNANLPAAAASLLPLAYAPHASTWFSLVVICTPVLLIAFGRSHLWPTPLLQACAIALYVLSPNFTSETWLNSINLMVHFGFISLILLCDDTRHTGPAYGRVSLILLLLAGLSGVYGVFLVPAFLLKFWSERTPLLRRQLSVLIATALVQLILFAWAYASHGPGARWDRELDVGASASAVVQFHVFKPLLGQALGRELFSWLGLDAGLRSGGEPGVFLRLALPLLVPALLVVLPAWRGRNRLRWVLLLAFVTESALSTLSARNKVAVGRYAMVPGMVLLFLWFSNAEFRVDRWLRPEGTGAAANRWLRAMSALLLATAATAGALGFRDHAFLAYTPRAPHWKHEIALWRQAPWRAISVWPYPRWTFYLPTRSQFAELERSVSILRERIREAVPARRLRVEAQLPAIPPEFGLHVRFDASTCSRIREVAFVVRSGGRERRHAAQAGELCAGTVRTQIRMADEPSFGSAGTIAFEVRLSEPVSPASLVTSLEARFHWPALFYLD